MSSSASARSAPTAAPPAQLGYQAPLDGLRCIAICLVVSFHYFNWPIHGDLGVDLFFVLSGFLITQLLLEERALRGGIALGRFYARRALRLLPALFVFLGVFGLVIVLHALQVGTFTKPDDVTSVLAEQWAMGLTFTTNIGFALGRAPYGDTQFLWSLALEEQYYLIWPLLLGLALSRRHGGRIAAAAAAVALTAIVAAHLVFMPAHPSTFDAVAVSRFDSILFGCLCALGYRRFPGALTRAARRPWISLAAVAAIAIIPFLPSQRLFYDGLTDEFDLAVCVVLLASLGGVTLLGRTLARRPLVFVGRISYAIYLWNYALLLWLGHGVGLAHLPTRLIGLALTFAVAVASYRFVERPFLRRKWRLARTTSHDVGLVRAVQGGGEAAEAPDSGFSTVPA